MTEVTKKEFTELMTTNTEDKCPLSAALLEAQRRILSVGREARNDFHDFDYCTGDKMLEKTRGVLHGVGLTVSLVRCVHKMIQTHLVQECTFRLCHAKSGISENHIFECPIVCDRGSLDKNSFGTNTGIWKYYIRGLLALPMGEDSTGLEDEPCSRDDREETTIDSFSLTAEARKHFLKRVNDAFAEDTKWAEQMHDWANVDKPEDMTDEQLVQAVDQIPEEKQ